MLALSVIKGLLRNGPYAWPGGYPLYFIADDGEALSFQAVHENWREIARAHIAVRACPSERRNHSDWLLVGYDVNWEDAEMYCAHTNERIPSAYCD